MLLPRAMAIGSHADPNEWAAMDGEPKAGTTAPPAELKTVLDPVQKGPRGDAVAWLLGVVVPTVVVVIFLVLVPAVRHWFVIPTLACGILVGGDVGAWTRRTLDALEPRAIVAIFGAHFFFLAPLLHVTWDYWPSYLPAATDWRYSLGVVSLLNAAGLILYRLVLATRTPLLSFENYQIDPRRMTFFATVGAVAGICALAVVASQFGGLTGYLAVAADDREEFAGSGWLLLVGEAWPLLLFAAAIVRKRDWLRSHRGQLALLFLLFLAAQFLCGGLRGSRSNTLWPTLIAIGMIHLLVVRIRRRTLAVGAVAILAFMHFYAFYKAGGSEGAKVLRSGSTGTSQLAASNQVSLELVLLEDFGRAGTQAVIIDRQQRGSIPALGLGSSYLGALSIFVPEALAWDHPADKVALGTDALYGRGAYDSGTRSSRVYGLLGEGVLNFGLAGAPLLFLVLGVYVKFATRIYRSALGHSSVYAGVLGPAIGISALVMLGSDFGNLLWFAIRLVLPITVVLLLSRKRRASL